MKQGDFLAYSTNCDMILEHAIEFSPRIIDPFAAIEQRRPRQPNAYGIGALKQYRRESHMTVQRSPIYRHLTHHALVVDAPA